MEGEPRSQDDAWLKLRGALKDVFAEFGGGEAYLRAERSEFYSPGSDASPPDQPR